MSVITFIITLPFRALHFCTFFHVILNVLLWLVAPVGIIAFVIAFPLHPLNFSAFLLVFSGLIASC